MYAVPTKSPSSRLRSSRAESDLTVAKSATGKVSHALAVVLESLESRRLLSAVQTFSALDPGAGPTDPRPNSDAEAAAFDTAAANIGNPSIITFEGAPTGSFTNLTVAPGVSISGTDKNGNSQVIVDGNADAGAPSLASYNTTANGSESVNVLGGTVTFTFATPIQFFGAYFPGAQNFFADNIQFFDGTSQTVDIPGGSSTEGGVSFAGFTDPGASITSVTINGGPASDWDAFGVDDVRYGSTSGAPVVTTNPSNQSALIGSTVTFTAAASGDPSPTVQWQISTDRGIDYSDIDGATSDTYSFTATPQFNLDEFRAVFTNSEGTAYSTGATLTDTVVPVPLRLHTSSTLGPLAIGKVSPTAGDATLASLATVSNLQNLWLTPAITDSGSATASPAANTFAADGLIAPLGRATYSTTFSAVNDRVQVGLSMSAAAGVMNLLDTVLPASAWKPSDKLIDELDKIYKTTSLFNAKADLTAAAAGRVSAASAAHAIASYTTALFANGGAQWKLVKSDLKDAGVVLTTAEVDELESATTMTRLAKKLVASALLDTQLVTGAPLDVDFFASAG